MSLIMNDNMVNTEFLYVFFQKLSNNEGYRLQGFSKNNMKKKDVGEVKKAIMNLEKKSEEFIEKRMNSSLDEIIKGKKIEDIDNA